MSLWSIGALGIQGIERKSIITPKRAQELYDATATVTSSINVLRQVNLLHGGTSWKIVTDAIAPVEEVLRTLMWELSLERGSGPYPAQKRNIPPDRKWLEQLRELARAEASGMATETATVARVVRVLMEQCKEVSNTLFATYLDGVSARLPVPLLSALKSAVGVLDCFSNLELLELELARLKREVGALASFCRAFDRPEAASLEAAAAVLQQGS